MEQLSDNRRIGPNEKRDTRVLKLYESLALEHREGVVAIRDNGPLLCLGTVMTEDGYILTKASELSNAMREGLGVLEGGRGAVTAPSRVVPDGPLRRIGRLRGDSGQQGGRPDRPLGPGAGPGAVRRHCA